VYADDAWRGWTACVFAERELGAAAAPSGSVAAVSTRAVTPAPQTARQLEDAARTRSAAPSTKKAPRLPPLDPHVATALRAWRTERAAAEQKPEHTFATVALINALARLQPRSPAQLKAVPGMDVYRALRYGDEMMDVIQKHQ
jgi:superfamily II DNA helicase RecQ